MKAYTREHNNNKMNSIIALDTEELRNFINGEEEEVLTIKEMVVLANEKEEAERKAREEEEQEYLAYTKALNSITEKVKNLLANGENLTIEDIAIISGLLDTYSDMYKDINGFRPRSYMEMVWEAIENVAPNSYACVEQMRNEDKWWDFAFEVQRNYWQSK